MALHPFLQQLADAGLYAPDKPHAVADLSGIPTAPAGDESAARYAQRALESELDKVASAAEGTRNHTLNTAAFSLGQLVAAGHLDGQEVLEALTEAAQRCGLDPREIGRTVPRGLRDGAGHPRVVRLDPSRHGAREAFTMPETDGTSARKTQPADEPLTDLGNARRLVDMHGHQLRYLPVWKRWLVWDGKRWALDDTGQVWRYAKDVARSMLLSAMKISNDKERRDKLIKAAQRAEGASGLRAMVELAGTEEGVALAPGQLDADPWLLNCANGTLDLRTLQLTEHDPTAHITKMTAAAYHPGAGAPRFEAFLERIQPDPTMRAFLARLLGYALTGLVVEHILPIAYGGGSNGKSTLLETVIAALGDYGDAVEAELLVDTGSKHPTGVADLFGLRLALTQETDRGRRLAEGTVKRLTGGDTVRARRMRENFWSFEPSHTVVLQTNHKPVIGGTDEGIWRRVKLVPFEVAIPEDERDSHLKETLVLEIDGILAWLVKGYRDYTEQGLAEPEKVTAATAAYRGESDDLGRFIDECCITGKHFHVKKSDLFAAWVKWCATENVDAGTQTAFGSVLLDRGFDGSGRDARGGRIWRGIAFLSEESEVS